MELPGRLDRVWLWEKGLWHLSFLEISKRFGIYQAV